MKTRRIIEIANEPEGLIVSRNREDHTVLRMQCQRLLKTGLLTLVDTTKTKFIFKTA